MNDLGLSCNNFKNMTDTNKLLWLILQEMQTMRAMMNNGPQQEELAIVDDVREQKINAMSRNELMAEIKKIPKDKRPFGWTKMKTDEMRQILRQLGA